MSQDHKATHTNDWTKMKKAEKATLLGHVLSRAVTEMAFRDRCLASESSAIAAIAEIWDVEFPRDFKIMFADAHLAREETNFLVLRLPKFAGEGSGVQIPVNSTTAPCTYSQW